MKRNTLFYLVVLFVLLNIVDTITTLFILPGESNPIYLLTKSLIIVLLLKIAIVCVVCWIAYKNKYTTENAYFLYITILLYGTLVLLLAQIGNIYAIMHPAVLQQAATMTTQEKVASYNQLIIIVYALPIIFTWLCFVIYQKSVKDVIFKKREHWWEW